MNGVGRVRMVGKKWKKWGSDYFLSIPFNIVLKKSTKWEQNPKTKYKQKEINPHVFQVKYITTLNGWGKITKPSNFWAQYFGHVSWGWKTTITATNTELWLVGLFFAVVLVYSQCWNYFLCILFRVEQNK